MAYGWRYGGVSIAALGLWVAGCTATDVQWEPPEHPERTLGGEIFTILCARVAADVEPTDVRGRNSNSVCYAGQAPSPKAHPKVVAMYENRDRLISALDAALVEGGLQNELDSFLGELLPLYDVSTEPLPGLTRAFGDVLATLAADEDALLGLQRMSSRQGYRPLDHALGAAQAVFKYERLHELLLAVLAAIEPGSDAAQAWDEVLTALSLELADYQPAAEAESTLEATRQFLFRTTADDFAPAEQRFLVRRDDRGVAMPRQLCANPSQCPFADMDGDGRADLDPEKGRFMGGDAATPFSIVGEAAGAVPRDALQRALNQTTGELLYDYVDVHRTAMGALSRELRPLFEIDEDGRNTLMDLLHGVPVVMGGSGPQQLTYGEGQLDYTGSLTRQAPALDFVQVLGLLARSPQFENTLTLTERLVQEHETTLAALIDTAFKARERAVASDAALNGPNELWDDILYWTKLMARTSRVQGETMLEGLMRAVADDRARHFGDMMAMMMRFRDGFSYDPNNINDLPRGSFVTPVDRAAADLPDNRSIFHRSLNLLGDVSSQRGLCNKSALLIIGECSVMDFEDLGRVFGGSMSEDWRLQLGGAASLLPTSLTGAVLGIEGLDEYPDPPAMVRMLFTDVALVDVLLDPLTVRNAPDRSEAYWLKRVYANTIEAWEVPVDFDDGTRVAFWDTFRPLAEAFNRHDYDPLDDAHANDEHKWYIYMELAAALGYHYGSPDGGYAQARSQPFYDHETNVQSFETMIADILASPGLQATDCGSDPSRCYVTEQTLAAFPTNLGMFERFHELLKVLDGMEFAGGDDGIDVLAGLAEFMLNPHKACKPDGAGLVRPDGTGPCDDEDRTYDPIVYRRSDGQRHITTNLGTTWDGTLQDLTVAGEPLITDAAGRPVVATHEAAVTDGAGQGTAHMQPRYVSPLQVVLRSLNDIDRAFEQSTLPDTAQRLAHWRAARSDLVDQFFATDGTSFTSPAARAVVLAGVGFLKDRLRSHREGACAGADPPAGCGIGCADDSACGAGLACSGGTCAVPADLDAWADGLVGRSEVFMRTPTLAATLQLLEAFQNRSDVLQEFGGLLDYLFDDTNAQRSLDTTLLAIMDLIQVLRDDANVVPVMRALSGSVSKDAAGFVAGSTGAVGVASGPARRTTSVLHSVLQLDSQRALVKLLGNLVQKHSTHLAGREAPLETIIDVIAEVNRAAPSSERGQAFESRDYQQVFDQVREFLVDERRGLERIYDIVQNKDG